MRRVRPSAIITRSNVIPREIGLSGCRTAVKVSNSLSSGNTKRRMRGGCTVVTFDIVRYGGDAIVADGV